MTMLTLLVLGAGQGVTLGEVRGYVPPRLKPPAMPRDRDNGWPLLLKAAGRSNPRPASFYGEDDAAPAPYVRTVSTILSKWRKKPEPADLRSAKRALASYESQIRFLKAALARPTWASPRQADQVRPTLGPAIADFAANMGMKELAKALALRARVHAFEGKGSMAVADVALARRMGSRLSEGNTHLVNALVGSAIEAIADDAALQISGYPKIGPVDVAALRKIVAVEPNPRRVANTLRVEFDTYSLPTIAAVPSDPEGLAKAQLIPSAWVTAVHGLPLFDRRETVRLLAEPFLSVGIKDHPSEPKKPPFLELKPGQRLTASETEHLRRWIRANPNFVGRELSGAFGSIPQSFEESMRNAEAGRRLTLSGIAVREALLRTKKMPASLELLFGKGKVPLDPFGHGPLRYDAKTRRIWSVGKDGKDDGGQGKPNGAKPDKVVVVP